MRDFEKISSFFDISNENLLLKSLTIKKSSKSFYESNLNINCSPRSNIEETPYFKQLEENLLLVQKGNDYTINEIDTFLKYYDNRSNQNYNFIDLINNISENYVRLNPEPHIDQCKIIEWREIVQHCGEDMFICYKIAKERDKVTREDFSWSPIIISDDRRLHTILNQPVSENHNHLLGSAPIGDLNWTALHNNDNFWNFLSKEQYKNSHFSSDSFHIFKIRMIKAMVIRYYFFKKLSSTFRLQQKYYENVFESLQMNSLNVLSSFIKKNSLNPIKAFKKDTYELYEDYTMSIYDSKNIWEGERALLYLIFKNYSSFNYNEKLLVYLYLIYKTHFTNQFVEKRKTPGFLQFERFENYKEAFLEVDKKYKDIMISSALKATKACNIENLEMRVAPKNSKKDLKKYIQKIVVNSTKAKCEMEGNNNWINNIYIGNSNELINLKPNTYIVFHFIKGGLEKNKIKKEYGILYQRNYKTRKRIEKQAKVLHDFLASNDPLSSIVLAIDAANKEIGCRPEVMGQIFRYLRKMEFLSYDDSKKYRCLNGTTYHVGEDFMDITDGLRAIYEAILFLNIHPGDRLGHAIALGINPREYYELKKMDIYKSKQDTLDDYVWMFFALNKMGSYEHETFKNSIQYKIQKLIKELYEDNIDESYTLSDYYDSMKLRGDNPTVYLKYFTSKYSDENSDDYLCIDSYFEKECKFVGYSSFALNDFEKAKDSRLNKKAVKLFYKYHYSIHTRLEGDKIEHLRVDEEYIKAVESLQKYVKKEYILNNRLVIEVNLTSNYIIGSYRGYKYSTLSSFNKYLLDPSKDDNLQVCINTDDSGVFASNLFTEYSILLQILTHPENSLDDTQKYDTEAVYGYINYLRKMSNVFSFANGNKDELQKITKKIIPTIK